MNLISLGISHRTADIAVREQFALTSRALLNALRELADEPGIHEIVILSTCNRTELIAHADSAEPLLRWFSQRSANPSALGRHLEQRQGADVVIHLFRIAAGLDSMVLGEPEILGQTKGAWKTAGQAGTLGPLTAQLFEAAFATAKRIRSATDIGKNPVSVPTVTTNLARQIFGDLKNQQILFVGAGDMVQACMQHFAELQPRLMRVANRSLEKAQSLARGLNAEALTLEQLPEALPDADIVISCTAASETLIHPAMVKAALKKRRHRPIFIVDLAVPRDVDPAVADLRDIFLYTIDDLQQVASGNLGQRQQAAEHADVLLGEDVRKFQQNWQIHQAGQFIRSYREHARQLAEQAQVEALSELEAGAEAREVITRLSHKLAQQLLHQPSRNLRQIAAEGDEELLKRLTDMFRVEKP